MSSNIQSNSEWYPGQIWTSSKSITGLTNRKTIQIIVTNTGDRPIQVGSHFHFFECNKMMDFDRVKAYGMRLAIPSGTAIRFEPGQSHNVTLIELGGERVVIGFNNLINGELDKSTTKKSALKNAKKNNFKGI